MAFMDLSHLSVKGKASPRHERPFSGKRSGYANRNANTKANIFGINEPSVEEESPKKTVVKTYSNGSLKSATKYRTPNAPRDSDAITIPSAGVISQSELDTTKKLIGSSETKKTEAKVFEVNGKLYVDNPRRPRSRKAPEGVPKLQLGALADRDDELRNPRNNQSPNLATPDSQTSVSWGTPVHNQYYNHNEETSYQVCAENAEERLMSSQRQKPKGIPDLDLQLSHSGNEQFRKALRERNKREKELHKSSKLKVDATEPWIVQPQKDSEMMMKVADEKTKLRVTRKNEIIDEALVGDELMRETVADGVQARPSAFNGRTVGPRQKRHQALFNRNPTATTTVSENLLSERLRFSARILSKDGHDAHRELNGFYFPADNTLTVYEFRQFGSRSSALPFIQRGKYYHAKGRTKDEPYTYQDIAVGNDLVFETSEQLSLPEKMKRKAYATLRITDVDMETKQKFAFKDTHTPIGVVSPSHELLQRTTTKEDAKDKELIAEVKALVRNQLKRRGVKTMTGLGRHFQSLDTTGDGTVDKDELKEALEQFNIQIPPERFDEIWDVVDANHDGALDYDEFTRNFIGEMNERRKALVLKVFRKMDANKRGVVPLTNLTKFYSVRQHPHVISGKVTEEEVRQQLLNTFEHCKKKGEVSYSVSITSTRVY
ncbi:calcyphosin-2 isoform X1 [Paramuricea clavata]|uniref:Calcyphosin-2 isoform X1 n=1 Tax=Paramuricea clavata TaxID=317549 RepID=A0A7D9IAD3_PARCT|nr:calcyphosin-2 isoform X1 [Paramuricea clavata]